MGRKFSIAHVTVRDVLLLRQALNRRNMRLTLLSKDDKSGEKGCPSVYMADTGELVVQGAQLGAADMHELQNPLPGETAVRIAPEVVLKAAELYKQNREQ